MSGFAAELAETYPYLPPGWVSAETPQGVAVFAGGAAALVEGEGAKDALAALLPLLDGARPERAVRLAAPGIPAADVGRVLAALREAGVLCAAPDAAAAERARAERRARVACASFAVSGAPPWAQACAAALRAEGARAVRVGPDEPGGPDALIAVEAPGGFSLGCVLADGEIALGPLSRAGRPGCWRCAALRRAANAPFAEPRAADRPAPPGLCELGARLLAKLACDALCAPPGEPPLDGRMLLVDGLSLAASEHRVLPAPGCPVCGGPPAASGGGGPAVSAEAALAALAELVDGRVGVINCLVFESGARLGLERPVVATAVTACAPDGAQPPTRMPVGWGKGMGAVPAALSAAGEALERYCASLPDLRRVVWARPGDLPPGEVADPRAFPLFEPAQYAAPGFPYVPFDPDVRHPWIPGWRPATGAPAWVPAIFSYLAFTYERRQNICSGTSNGLAAGVGADDAGLRAVLELVERDAFMAAWRTRVPGRPVAVGDDWDADLLSVLRGVEALGAKVRVGLLPSACGYPAALCLAFGDGQAWPGVTLGLGADPDPRAAIRQAVLELGQTGPYLRRLMREGAQVPARPDAVRGMMDHAAYYFAPGRAVAFEGLIGEENALAWGDLPSGPARSLDGCVAALEAAGARVWLADVTSADVALTPFRVVRAVSPELQPISFGFGLDRASTARIAAQAASLPAEWVSPIW